MKTNVLITSLAFLLPLCLFAQNNVSEIFDDLQDLKPAASPRHRLRPNLLRPPFRYHRKAAR